MKKLISAALCSVMAVSGTINASAAEIIKHEAELRPDISIIIDDDVTYFKSASGEYVYPILFRDSTYLPLRAIGEIMGKNVNWDEKNKTITLSGERDSYRNTSKASYERRDDIKIEIRKDFKIVVDGKEVQFKDANGKRVYPILYNGSTYLPLRAIGEIMDCDVIWDGGAKSITLEESALTVTDADSFEEKNKFGIIDGIEEIKNKILADAGIKKGLVKFTDIDKEYDDGVWKYEISFVYEGHKYTYEIEINTGKIINKISEKLNRDELEEVDVISKKSAIKIVLNYADYYFGIDTDKITEVSAVLDEDDGKLVYEVEFEYEGVEYEFELDAETGTLQSVDTDSI